MNILIISVLNLVGLGDFIVVGIILVIFNYENDYDLLKKVNILGMLNV